MFTELLALLIILAILFIVGLLFLEIAFQVLGTGVAVILVGIVLWYFWKH